MEVLEKPSAHFHLAHALKTESRIWGVCNEEARVTPLETARRWYGAMLTTCPNCLHVFDQPLSSSCCASSRSAHDPSPPAPHPRPHHSPPPGAGAGPAGAGAGPPPLLLSATLQLPPSAVPTTCTLAVTAPEPPQRALAAMAGGGLVLQQHPLALDSSKASSAGVAPQPSPSAPLSFQWAVPGPAAVHVNVQVPAPAAPAPLPHSETDLERLAATMSSLRASGWYYEGLSWQESADLLQATAPGTFLVRDSSDPRFLFSLSVQTERGPTSVRLHYVSGNFRLDAEPRLAPLMPLFDCVVKLVEHYVQLTRHRREDKPPRDKEQVWVDARGQMYSHILLRSPLYKRAQRPSLQHLARLAINKQVRAAGRAPAAAAPRLPLPAPLRAFVGEYPYTA